MTGRRAGALTLLVTAALAAAACSSSSAANSSGSSSSSSSSSSPSASTSVTTAASTTATTCSRPHAAGESSQTFEFENVARTYQLYVPRSYTGSTPVPVVFDFHGFGSNAVQQMTYSHFQPLADQNDFLVVAPDGQGKVKHFSFVKANGQQNDLAMTMALLDHIESTFCVDTARVYSTGMSDGGAVTSLLACVAPKTFAAFAPVAVQIAPKTCTKHTVAMVAFHGTADPVVPYNGGKVTCCGGANLGPVPSAMATWAAHDACDPKFVDTRLGTEVSRRAWSGCSGTSDVILYTIVGGGHTWPGAVPVPRLGMTTSQIDASTTIWEFFAAHPLTS